jgi:adenosylmethionine-8-amino-7-oxononanoate aminotransferase
VLTTEAVYGAFYDDDAARGFLHSHSYTGSALACRAALATLEIFADDDILAVNRDTARRFASLCAPLLSDPRVEHFRQAGMIWAFEVRTTRPHFAREFFAAALRHGMLLRPIGRTVYFMPPYVVSDAQFAALVAATLQTINELET